jgi:hypothetical protein
MGFHNLTWNSIQDYDIKNTWKNTKGEGIPRGWGCLHGIVNKNIHPPIKTEKALLKYYNIDFNWSEETNVVTLVNTSEYAK